MVTLWLLLVFNISNNSGYPQTPLQVFTDQAQCVAVATAQQSSGNPSVTWAGCAELAVQGVPLNPAPTPTPTVEPTPTATPT
jgi:hypothetical protein